MTGRTDQLPLMTRVKRFECKHPEIHITAPYSASGKWEVSAPDQAAMAFDTGMTMMDFLEATYTADAGRQP